jgi:hypothetical protein
MTMNFFHPNYKKFYASYKQLPGISAITMAVLVLAWSIVDVSVFSGGGWSHNYYGVMQLPSVFLALIIWWAIGAVLCFAIWFFSCLIVSATITRTDAILEIEKHLTNH